MQKKGEDPPEKSTYGVWLLLNKEYGTVELVHCECTGGADGGCRHLAATLYEIADYMDKVKLAPMY